MITVFDASHREGAAALWQQVFGDDPRYISHFLDSFPGTGAVAIEDGRLAAMAFVLTGIRCCEKEWGYLYAVATAPAFRGRGLGEAVSKAAAAYAGVDAICTLPAEGRLRDWYRRILHLDDSLCIREETILPQEGAAPISISSEAYQRRRESLLANVPHAVFQPAHYGLLEQLCRIGGGGLYRWKETILAVDCFEDSCYVREALGPDARDAAAAVAHFLGAENAILRTPAPEGIPYLSCPAGMLPPDTVWNITLD